MVIALPRSGEYLPVFHSFITPKREICLRFGAMAPVRRKNRKRSAARTKGGSQKNPNKDVVGTEISKITCSSSRSKVDLTYKELGVAELQWPAADERELSQEIMRVNPLNRQSILQVNKNFVNEYFARIEPYAKHRIVIFNNLFACEYNSNIPATFVCIASQLCMLMKLKSTCSVECYSFLGLICNIHLSNLIPLILRSRERKSGKSFWTQPKVKINQCPMSKFICFYTDLCTSQTLSQYDLTGYHNSTYYLPFLLIFILRIKCQIGQYPSDDNFFQYYISIDDSNKVISISTLGLDPFVSRHVEINFFCLVFQAPCQKFVVSHWGKTSSLVASGSSSTNSKAWKSGPKSKESTACVHKRKRTDVKEKPTPSKA